jgi:cold shock protein
MQVFTFNAGQGNAFGNAVLSLADGDATGAPAPVSPKPTKGPTNVPTGTVKFFNSAKDFGFIMPEEGDADVFVHRSAVERSGIGIILQEGMRLGFDVESDPKTGKPRAANLRLL